MAIEVTNQQQLDFKKEINEIMKDLSTYEKAVRAYCLRYDGGDPDGHLKPEACKRAAQILRFGVRITNKIDDFQRSGKLEEAEKNWCLETWENIRELSKVEGMGPIQAAEFVDCGIKTIDDLFCHTEKLTRQQIIGLEYYEDFNFKIPRKEVEDMAEVIKKHLCLWNPDYSMAICGSYRRGKKCCDNVDCLIISPQPSVSHADGPDALRIILIRLKTCGFVVDTICLGKHKFSGVCRLSEQHPARRLHLRLTPVSQLPFALLILTGPRIFAEKLMRKALEQKMSLNEYSLRKLNSDGVPGSHANVKSEEEIFEMLSVPYIPPQDRK